MLKSVDFAQKKRSDITITISHESIVIQAKFPFVIKHDQLRANDDPNSEVQGNKLMQGPAGAGLFMINNLYRLIN